MFSAKKARRSFGHSLPRNISPIIWLCREPRLYIEPDDPRARAKTEGAQNSVNAPTRPDGSGARVGRVRLGTGHINVMRYETLR
jgi:hypothetical protein